uniref:Uncharacterized protein n=1 Tax=Acrobeloides nanus TaxID=290746 RepID=A0A914BXU2_9BILA
MGCRMSRRSSSPSPPQTPSTDAHRNNGDFHGLGSASPKTKPSFGRITNGQSVLSRRDTPAGTLLDVVPNKNGYSQTLEQGSK